MLNNFLLDNPPNEASKEQLEKFKKDTAEMVAKLRKETEIKEKILKEGKRKILNTEPDLVNFNKALDCNCNCHPKAYDPTVHNDQKCRCQLSDAELLVQRKEAMAALSSYSAELSFNEDAMDKEVAEMAKKLNVTIKTYGGGAPFVIEGTVDGRTFYLRDRHEQYRLVVSGENDPLADVYHGSPKDALIIARGDSGDLPNSYQNVSELLTVVVETVRLFLLRETCEHILENNFCSKCGSALTAAYNATL